jgi:hypothetical protein
VSSESGMAEDLTRFLTDRDGYKRTSEIERYVQTRIRELAGDMADEVVQANPEIRAALDTMIRTAIRAALADNDQLQRIVAEKVAAAILKIGDDE